MAKLVELKSREKVFSFNVPVLDESDKRQNIVLLISIFKVGI